LLWEGEELTEPGLYTAEYTSTEGCDSIVELDLSIAPEYNDTVAVQLCLTDTFYFNGEALTSTGWYTTTFTSVSGCDSIVTIDLNVSPEEFLFLEFEICEGDTFDFNGRKLYEAGTYFDTLGTVNGCDSLLEILLVVTEVPNQILEFTVCPGEEVMYNNQVYANEGIYLDTLEALSGCDSIVYIEINHSARPELFMSEEICSTDSIFWNGDYYNESGVYRDTLTSSLGCDSLISLNLIVQPEWFSVESITLCEGEKLAWNGQLIDEPGVFSSTLSSVLGCDSVAQITVEYQNHQSQTLSLDLCFGDTVFYDQYSFTEPGIFTDTLATSAGCDSILTFNVNSLPQYYNEQSAEICEGESWNFSGTELTESGTYIDSSQSVMGCDSVEILHLQVLPFTRDTLHVSLCEGTAYEFDGEELQFSGVYRDTMESADACLHIQTLFLEVFPNEILIDLPDDTILRLGEDLPIFPEIYSPHGTSSYYWSPPDDLSCTECINTVASPKETTQYTFHLLDSNGCSASANIKIYINMNVDIYIPNVFTPNNDGINDVFHIHTGGGVDEVELLEIYDRWGERVFQNTHFPPNDPSYGWDGTFRGRDMNPQVFVYSAFIRLDNGRIVIRKGDITLIRG
jgi:gliding motility-associated-like protein